MSTLAEARRLSRRFGGLMAVSAVDLSVGRGEVVGLLGANGAGKTTLIRLLLGVLRPTAGEVLLFGTPPELASRRRVGYVPQTLGLYATLTVAENWAFTAAAFGRRGRPVPDEVSAWRDKVVAGLPLGIQRQVAFAVALAHQPELLVLDEPTSGVGPLGRARLWEEIRRASQDGAGVLVTTHDMGDAGQCDRLVVMADGRVAAEGTAAGIIGDRTVTEVRGQHRDRAFAVLDGAGIPVQIRSTTLRAREQPAAVAGLLASAGLDATARPVPADLEEAFEALVTAPGRVRTGPRPDRAAR